MQNPAAEQVVKTLKSANCVLVTVKNSPSVDELTAAIGLTLILNRMHKHAVTVFSGKVPSTLEFLQPDMAIEANTDSLRDFIIALDKSKADKLRYKVEDNVVRIFITPYKTSISERDLEFSQGEFNVDAVIALGVTVKEDFDEAVTAHGRILHDATVVTLTARDVTSQLGAINWHDQLASGVSEMIASITDQLGPDIMDGQIATSLMTGIVAETDRFKNSFTTPQVLSLSSKLMTAGANQQLIAEKLDHPLESSYELREETGVESVVGEDGSLDIAHGPDEIQKIEVDDNGNLQLPENNTALAQNTTSTDHKDENRTYMDPQMAPKLFGVDDSGTENAQPLFTPTDASPNLASEPSSESPTSSASESMSSRPQKVVEPLSNQVPDSNNTNPESVEDYKLGVSSKTDVDNFMGTNQSTPQPIVKLEPVEQASDTQTHTNDQESAPSEDSSVSINDPTAPPVVPPPLMPQAPAQPQFFDSDGTNQNPFLNPN
jgi:hypothetical protein